MFDGLPGGWETTTLGAIATLGGGTTPSKGEKGYWQNGTVPWATPTDITSLPTGCDRISKTEVEVSERALAECSLTLNPPGTVLMTSRATIGYAAINDVPMTTNQGFINFRCGERADPQFILYWLMAKREFLVAAAGGSTFKELSRGTAKLLPILLPPLDEQRRIAEVLRSVAITASRLAELRTATENLLMLYRRLTFLPLFCDSDESNVILADICDIGRGFAFKSTDYVENGVLNFRVTNVGRPLGDIGEKKFLPNEFLSQFEEYRLCGGEIVLVMVGATVGKLGRVPEELCPALLNQNMWTLQPKGGVSRELLWHLAHILIEEKVHGAQGGAYSFLTKKDFLRHTISNMSFDALQPHVAAMSAIEAVLELLCQEHSALLSMQSTISDDLLSGRVRVPV